jgi:hypothetical protein
VSLYLKRAINNVHWKKYLSSIAPGNLEPRRLSSANSNWHSTSIAPSSYSFHFNYIQYHFPDLRYQMPFWKPKSKLAGRVFAILHLRPTTDKEELEPTNGLAGYDRADLPSSFKPLSTSMVGLTTTRADPTIAQSDTSPSLSDDISSSDDPVHEAHNQQRYETDCSH